MSNNHKKVLILGAHTRHPFKVGMLAEIVKTELEKGNEVKYLHCECTTNGYCGLTRKHYYPYCKKCIKSSLKVLEWNNFPEDDIITMKKFEASKFPNFESIQDLKNFEIEGLNAGDTVLSCIMSLTRDYMPSIKKYQKEIHGFLRTEYIVLKNLQEVYKEFPFDTLHTFNGRFAMPYIATRFCIAKNIDFYLYDGRGDYERYFIAKNDLMHSMDLIRNLVNETWQNTTLENKEEIANEWFEEKKASVSKASVNFTAKQKTGYIPNLDMTKENIGIFNSSLDEYYAFDDFRNPIADNENDILEAILEKYKDDETKHFYLRIHPNLKKAEIKRTTQILEIEKFKKRNYKNVTFIDAHQEMDTYSLIGGMNKVITFISTVGIEATFAGKPSILAGNAFYDRLDCVWQAKNYEELFKLIDDKNLLPKPKENIYPYGFFIKNFGKAYQYYKPTAHNVGTFMGNSVKIYQNPITSFLKEFRNSIREKLWKIIKRKS